MLIEQISNISQSQKKDFPQWVLRQKEEALKFVQEKRLPTTKDEKWRYTDVSVLDNFEHKLNPIATDDQQLISHLEKIKLQNLDEIQVVFIDGVFSMALSSLEKNYNDFEIKWLNDCWEDNFIKDHFTKLSNKKQNSFSAMNTACYDDVLYLHIKENSKIDRPIHIIYFSTENSSKIIFPRIIINAEANSKIFIIEDYYGLANKKEFSNFTNSVNEVFVANGAQVDHYKVQRESESAVHIAQVVAQVQEGGKYYHNHFSIGAKLARNDIEVNLTGENSNTKLNGVYLLQKQQHLDNHTNIEHIVANCQSSQAYHGILGDKSTGVFNGRVHVHPNAIQTIAKQSSKTLLLSEESNIYTKPELEIYADDVECAHGATIGQIDENMYFYLLSRGISKKEAYKMLTVAFASEIIHKFELMPIRGQLDEILSEHVQAVPSL